MPTDGRIVNASQRDCIGSLELLRRDSDTIQIQLHRKVWRGRGVQLHSACRDGHIYFGFIFRLG